MQCPNLIPTSASIWCDDGDCPHLGAPARLEAVVQNTDGDCARGGQVLFGWQPLGTSSAATPIGESYVYPPVAPGSSGAATTVWVPDASVVGYPTGVAIGWLWATAWTDGTIDQNCFCDGCYPTPDPSSPYTILVLAPVSAQSCISAMAAAAVPASGEAAAQGSSAESSQELVFGFLARHRLGNGLKVRLAVRPLPGAGLLELGASLDLVPGIEKSFASGLLRPNDPLIAQAEPLMPQTEICLEPRQTRQALLRVRFPKREKGQPRRGLLEVRLNVAEGRYQGRRIGGFVIGVENDRMRPVWHLPGPAGTTAKDRDED
jgi:hypothetical protein